MRAADPNSCVHRQLAIELGNEWQQASRAKARATAGGDATAAAGLAEQLRVLETAIRRQYAECQHDPRGDQQHANKGPAAHLRTEAQAPTPSGAGMHPDTARVAEATQRAYERLTSSK